MIVVGLDQAVKGIAYAYGEPGSVPARGYHELPDYGDNTARLGGAVRKWAVPFFKSTGAELIYFEEIFKGEKSLPVLFKQITVITNLETAADMIGLADCIFEVSVSAWRKDFFMGAKPTKPKDKSEQWKKMAMAQCLRKDWLVDQHDVAEACGIWFHSCMLADARFRHAQRIHHRRADLEKMHEEAA
jgi:hypothetical protein